MTKNYVSVIQWGNKIFYRGYQDGHRVSEKIDYSPTMFVASKKKTNYSTLHGEYVSPMTFGSINEAKEFVKSYKDVDGFSVYGMSQFAYPLARVCEHLAREVCCAPARGLDLFDGLAGG